MYQRNLKRFEFPNPWKLRIPLQSIEASEFSEVVQIDHQKICMTASGYYQVLVMIDHFSRRDVRSPDQYVNSETRLSDDVLIGQWNSFCRRGY